MKRLLLTILWLSGLFFAKAQVRINNIDSLKLFAMDANPDTTTALAYMELGFSYAFIQVDTGIQYAQKAIRLSRQLQYKKGEAAGLASFGWALWTAGFMTRR